MKNILIASILFYITLQAHGQWTPLSSGTMQNLHDVDFLNSEYGIAGGDSGLIFLTDNGGANWYPIFTGISGFVGSVHVVNTDTFLVSVPDANGFPQILYSHNAGLNWAPIVVDSFCNRPFDTDKRSDGKWFTSGSSIISSNNLGTSWDTLMGYTCGIQSITRLNFADDMTLNAGGLASGFVTYSAAMLRSEDGGEKLYECYPLSFPNADALTAFHFPYPDTGYVFMNHYNGFIAGNQNSLVKTYGYSLQMPIPGDSLYLFSSHIINTNLPGYMNDGYFENSFHGFAISQDGNIYETTDGGHNWTSAYNTSGSQLNRLSFPDVNTGYAVGDNGTILKYSNSTFINELDMNNISVFPNPASDRIAIRGLSSSTKYDYTILNVDGKILQKGMTNSSEKISLNNYSAGVYFIELFNGDSTIRATFLLR